MRAARPAAILRARRRAKRKAHGSSWQVLLSWLEKERSCRRRGRQQVGGPIEATMAQPRAGEAGSAGLRQHAVDVALVLRRGCTGKGERRWPQVEVEQAIAQARLVVVVALRDRGRHDLDLTCVQPEALVDRANLRLGGLWVGQKDAAGA